MKEKHQKEKVTVSLRSMNKAIWKMAKIRSAHEAMNMNKYIEKLILEDLKRNSTYEFFLAEVQ